MVGKFVVWVLLSILATSKSGVLENDGDKQLFKEDHTSFKDQSPVDIIVEKTKVLSLPPLVYKNLNTFDNSEVLLKNTGTTVRIVFPDNTLNLPEITGGPLSDSYTFTQMHLHWGDNDRGSEHEINGIRYAMEIHLVYYDTKYKSFDEAMGSTIGLCVFSIIGKISEENNPSLDPFIDDLQYLIHPDSEIKRYFNDTFFWIKESFIQDYFTYHGSLTTEPFKGCVNWIISNKTFNISPTQLGKFRLLHQKENNEENCINKNYRKLQDLHDRTVYSVRDDINNEQFQLF